jgi:hypothetical protein
VRDGGAESERLVDGGLERHGTTAAAKLVGSDQNLGAGVDDALRERSGGEAGKDDRVRSAETRAGEHGEDGLGAVGHIDSDSVALAHTGSNENIGETTRLLPGLQIGDGADIARLVALPDDGGARTSAIEHMTVETVVADVEFAVDEPRNVARAKAARLHVRERGEKVHQFVCFFPPKFVASIHAAFVFRFVRA